MLFHRRVRGGEMIGFKGYWTVQCDRCDNEIDRHPTWFQHMMWRLFHRPPYVYNYDMWRRGKKRYVLCNKCQDAFRDFWHRRNLEGK